jgi:hypothetical protein
MTNKPISDSHNQTDDRRRRSIVADLAFWSIAGAVVAALSGPLGHWWNVPRVVLIAGGLAFLVGGVGLLLGLNRIRRPLPHLVQGMGMFNLAFAPIVWATALYGWLPLSEAGNWALVCAGGVSLGLGCWQLNALRGPLPAQQVVSR